jgi:hypothetical protein
MGILANLKIKKVFWGVGLANTTSYIAILIMLVVYHLATTNN